MCVTRRKQSKPRNIQESEQHICAVQETWYDLGDCDLRGSAATGKHICMDFRFPSALCVKFAFAALGYTENAPNAWHRRGTQKTGNTYNQPNRPNQQTSQTKHQAWGLCSYKRVKGRSHTVEKRKAIHPQKPHATMHEVYVSASWFVSPQC